MNKNFAQNLIKKTKDDYNKIAEQFASTRKFNWSDTTEPIREMDLKPGNKVLDLGCGNGRLYEILREYDIQYYGIDISEELVSLAKINIPDSKIIVGDVLETPYKDNYFDALISIAVLHHIPSQELREKALKEIYRIVKPRGSVMITTWYFWDTKRYLKLIESASKDDLPYGDFYMPWKTGSGEKVTERYFHAWKLEELEKMLKDAGFKDINVRRSLKSSGKPGYNLIATAKKV